MRHLSSHVHDTKVSEHDMFEWRPLWSALAIQPAECTKSRCFGVRRRESLVRFLTNFGKKGTVLCTAGWHTRTVSSIHGRRVDDEEQRGRMLRLIFEIQHIMAQRRRKPLKNHPGWGGTAERQPDTSGDPVSAAWSRTARSQCLLRIGQERVGRRVSIDDRGVPANNGAR